MTIRGRDGARARLAALRDLRSRSARGFTLIELMVVIVILGMLVALVGPNVWHMLTSGTKGAANAQMSNIQSAIQQYVLENRTLPNTLDDLTQVSKTTNQPIMEKIPLDPWEQPYQYKKIDAARKTFEIWSYGEDKNPDTDDDLHWPPRDQK